MSAKRVRLTSSSESDLGNLDQRKGKRMISNRESARRSRMKKRQHLGDLLNEAARLKNENGQVALQIELISRQYSGLEAENGVLRARLMELTGRLKSMSSVLRVVEEFSGMDMDIPEIPDPLLEPWKLPRPAQPILATPNVIKF